MATKLFQSSIVTASPSLSFKCPKNPSLEDNLKSAGDVKDEPVFVLLHNVATNTQLCGRSLLLLAWPLVSAAGFCLSHPASISTIISRPGFHWIFPIIICLMGSCQFAANPSLAKQPREVAELGKFDSGAMLTNLSGINHKLHSSPFTKRMPSFDDVHVGWPVKWDWQPIASSVQGKIAVLTIWQLSSEAPVGKGRCDGEQAIRACHAAVPENPSAEQLYVLVFFH